MVQNELMQIQPMCNEYWQYILKYQHVLGHYNYNLENQKELSKSFSKNKIIASVFKLACLVSKALKLCFGKK